MFYVALIWNTIESLNKSDDTALLQQKWIRNFLCDMKFAHVRIIQNQNSRYIFANSFSMFHFYWSNPVLTLLLPATQFMSRNIFSVVYVRVSRQDCLISLCPFERLHCVIFIVRSNISKSADDCLHSLRGWLRLVEPRKLTLFPLIRTFTKLFVFKRDIHSHWLLPF